MTTPPSARRPALRILDLVVGIVVVAFSFLLGLVTITILSSIQVDPARCGDGCDTGGLTTIVVAGIGVQIFAWALSLGFFIVRLVRRRLAFFWPIIGLVVMVAGYYATAAAISAWTAASLGAS